MTSVAEAFTAVEKLYELPVIFAVNAAVAYVNIISWI